MTAPGRMKRTLRDRSEHYLMLAAIRDLGAGKPGTVAPFDDRSGLLWRTMFVPLYQRLPWPLKRRAMETLRMTATGWQPPERRPHEPWRPPPAEP
jgi:hypothetical protein